jgi:hypothetical protein
MTIIYPFTGEGAIAVWKLNCYMLDDLPQRNAAVSFQAGWRRK